MKLRDEKEVHGEVTLYIYKQGKLIEEERLDNLVVDGGRCRLAQLIGGKSQLIISQIGIGSNAEEPQNTDEQLQEQILLPLRDWTGKGEIVVNGKDASFYFEIKSDEGNGIDIHEFGLFTSDNILFSRRIRSGTITKDEDISIKGIWIIHF